MRKADAVGEEIKTELEDKDSQRSKSQMGRYVNIQHLRVECLIVLKEIFVRLYSF